MKKNVSANMMYNKWYKFERHNLSGSEDMAIFVRQLFKRIQAPYSRTVPNTEKILMQKCSVSNVVHTYQFSSKSGEVNSNYEKTEKKNSLLFPDI